MSRGLVLEGGGLRGIFTAGVLDCFMDKGLYFDTAIGVSAGTVHGCSYQARQKGRAFRVGTSYLNDPRYCSVYSLITTGDLFGADFCYRVIPDLLDRIDYAAFRENPMRFYATVTDVENGKAVYKELTDPIRQIDWIRASASLPIISRKVKIDGKYYLDGGCADSIPYLKSIHLGNEKNVVVLTRESGYRKEQSSMQPVIAAEYRHYPAFVEVNANRHLDYNRTLELLEQDEAAGKVFVIRPPYDLDIGRVEKNLDKMRTAYQVGYDETARLYDSLMAYLNG